MALGSVLIVNHNGYHLKTNIEAEGDLGVLEYRGSLLPQALIKMRSFNSKFS